MAESNSLSFYEAYKVRPIRCEDGTLRDIPINEKKFLEIKLTPYHWILQEFKDRLRKRCKNLKISSLVYERALDEITDSLEPRLYKELKKYMDNPCAYRQLDSIGGSFDHYYDYISFLRNYDNSIDIVININGYNVSHTIRILKEWNLNPILRDLIELVKKKHY